MPAALVMSGCALMASLLPFSARGDAGGRGEPGGPVSRSEATAWPPARSSAGTPTLYAAASPASAPAKTGDRATDAFNRTNHRRALLGLSPLARDAALDRAAAAHLGYLAAHTGPTMAGHDELAGKPGYTGATPGIRAVAAGYSAGSVGENLAYATTPDGTDATDSLIDAPYHRQLQLGNFAAAGAAMGSGHLALYAIDFGGVAATYGPAPNQLVVYPAAGETAAPIDWLANETPNPLPDLVGRRVGFPISIGATSALTVGSFTLRDDQGVAVDLRLVTHRTDNGRPLHNYAFVVPLAPLAPGMRYTADATGTVDGGPFAVSWSFETAPLTALTISTSTSVLAAAPGSSIDIALSGGTGRRLSVGVMDFSYLSSTTLPIEIDSLVSVETTPSGSLRLRRGASTCSGALSKCQLRLRGEDSAGNRVVATVTIE